MRQQPPMPNRHLNGTRIANLLRLRAFIHAAYKSRPFDPESPFAKWLVWASLQADRMDPLKEGPPSVLDYERSH